VGTGKLHPALEECFGMESVVSITLSNHFHSMMHLHI